MKVKCIMCEVRPASDDGYCQICADKVQAIRKKAKRQQPYRYIVYRDNVIGLYPNNGHYEGRKENRSPEKLPKTTTINLDTYVPGFNRDQVKKMKKAVLQLCS